MTFVMLQEGRKFRFSPTLSRTILVLKVLLSSLFPLHFHFPGKDSLLDSILAKGSILCVYFFLCWQSENERGIRRRRVGYTDKRSYRSRGEIKSWFWYWRSRKGSISCLRTRINISGFLHILLFTLHHQEEEGLKGFLLKRESCVS